MPWFDLFRRARTAQITESQDDSPHLHAVEERHFIEGMPYLLPKDLEETNRLDFQHYMLRYALKGNYAAPIQQPRDILDVGAGTGRWAMEMAQQFPAASVIGTDVVPPSTGGAGASPQPDNYSFAQGNVLERLPFPENSFDFVHQRLLVLAIPAARWPSVVAELMRVTRPGGWIELIEGGDDFRGAPALERITTWGQMLLRGNGIDSQMAQRLGPLLREAGAVDITTRAIQLPFGKSGGHIGAMVEANTFSALAGLRGPIVGLNITTAEDFDATITQARAEIAAGAFTLPFFVASGRKPA